MQIARGIVIEVTFELPDHLSHIAYLRRQTRRLFEGHGISTEDIDDLETILGELATNAARHGRGGSYQVRVRLDGVSATITVTDMGNGFVPDLIPLPGVSRPDLLMPDLEPRIGGFGLPLVQTLSSRMEITPNMPHGTRVEVAKPLQTIV